MNDRLGFIIFQAMKYELFRLWIWTLIRQEVPKPNFQIGQLLPQPQCLSLLYVIIKTCV